MPWKITGYLTILAALLFAGAAAHGAAATMDTAWAPYSFGPVVELEFGDDPRVVENPEGLWGRLGERTVIHGRGDAWREVVLHDPLPEDAYFIKAEVLSNGAVRYDYIWDGIRMNYLLIYQGMARLLDRRILDQGIGSAPKTVLTNSHGLVWCERFPERIFPDAEVLWEVPREHPLFDWLPVTGRIDSITHHAAYGRDCAGRIWFTPERVQPFNNRPGIALIAPDGAEDPLPGPADAPWARAVAMFDRSGRRLNPESPGPKVGAAFFPRACGGMYVVVAEYAVWAVDPHSLEGALVFRPPHDLAPVVQVLDGPDHVYIVNWEALFRIEDGEATSVLPSGQYPQEIIFTDAGGWAAAASQGSGALVRLWFLPGDGGPPLQVDEQSGVALDECSGFMVTASGAVAAYNKRGRVSLLPGPDGIARVPALRRSPTPGSIGQIPPDPEKNRPGCGWAFFTHRPFWSESGLLYGFTEDRPGALTRWDGVTWETIEPPEAFAVPGAEVAGVMDLQGGLWMYRKPGPAGDGAAARFRPQDEGWECHDDLRALLQGAEGDALVFGDMPGNLWLPFRNTAGDAAFLTKQEVHGYVDGTWKAWPVADILRVIAETPRAALDGMPPIPEGLGRNAVVAIGPNREIMLRVNHHYHAVYRRGAWREGSMRVFYENLMPIMLERQGASPRMPGEPEDLLGWRPGLRGGWRLQDGRLYRSFDGEQTSVFPEDMAIPLPAIPEIVTGRAGPGGYPVLHIRPHQWTVVVLDPVLERPEIETTVDDGLFIRLAASNLKEDAALYWRFMDADETAGRVSYVMTGQGWVGREQGDAWNRLEGGAGRLGPFPAGEYLIEAVAVDGAQRTSEYYRTAATLTVEVPGLLRWARQVADAWPERAFEAEAALVATGRESLPVLAQVAAAVSPEQAPALNRVVHMLFAERRVPAPDPPVVLPEFLPASESEHAAKTLQNHDGETVYEPLTRNDQMEFFRLLVEGPEGRVWSSGNVSGRSAVALWTGSRWFGRNMPNRQGLIHPDSERRLWITGDTPVSPVWVYIPLDAQDLGEGVWRKYEDLFEALDDLWQPGLLFGPGSRYRPHAQLCLASMAARSRREMIFTAKETVYARIDDAWKRWGVVELPGAPATTTDGWVCAFDHEDRPLLLRDGDALRYARDGQWQVTTAAQALRLPEWALRSDYATGWEMRAAGLYRHDFGVSGLVVPREAFHGSAPDKVKDVIESFCGTLFLSIRRGNVLHQQAFRLHHPLQRPETRAEVRLSDRGQAILHVETDNGALRHTWRLVGGAWQRAVTGSEIPLPTLPPGRYEIEVSAVNSAALADLSPLRFTADIWLEVREADPMMLEFLLYGSVTEQNEAVRWFLEAGPDTLPELKALLEEAPDENTRWRIEALIQRME